MDCRFEKAKREWAVCAERIVIVTLGAVWIALSLTPVPGLIYERWGAERFLTFFGIGLAFWSLALREIVKDIIRTFKGMGK